MMQLIKDIVDKKLLETYDLSFLREKSFGGWSLDKDTCQFIGRVCERLRPRRVLEFGTGLSTLVLANEASKGNVGEIWSVDHLSDFEGHPRNMLSAKKQAGFVNFCRFPLKLTYLGGKIFFFYSVPRDFFRKKGPLDLVIIDGPPYYYNSREAALYAVYPHLSSSGLVILDDAKRKNREQAYLKNWKEYYRQNIDSTLFLDEFKSGLASIWLTEKKSPAFNAAFNRRMRDSWISLISAGRSTARNFRDKLLNKR